MKTSIKVSAMNNVRRWTPSIEEAAAYNWDISIDADNDAKTNIESSGNTTVIIPDDTFKQQMRDAVAPVYDYFYAEHDGSEEVDQHGA